MTKKFIIPLILVFILNSCGYSPIYSTKYQDFKFKNLSFNGERDVNKILSKSLDNYTDNTSAVNVYNITINSSLQKNIVTKDKKGNPTQFSLSVKVDLIIEDDLEKNIQTSFTEKNSYNNRDEKFELKIYESNLIQNMSEKILSDIILFIQNLN